MVSLSSIFTVFVFEEAKLFPHFFFLQELSGDNDVVDTVHE